MSPQTDANGFQLVNPTSTASSSGVDENGFQIVGGGASTLPRLSVSAPPISSSVDENGFTLASPDNGQPSSSAPKFDYQDPNKSWYERGWSWLNTPLTESLFGLPEDRPGAGGAERGLEHIVSGLTSPLSVALTAATFGTGGVIESAGMSALRESGEFTAEELPQIVKATQTAQQAFKDSKDVEPVIADALKDGGHDMDLLQRARNLIAPLNRDAELGGAEVQSGLSKVGLNEAERTALTKGEMTAAEREDIATKNGGFSDNELKALADTGKAVQDAKIGFKPIEYAVRESFGVPKDMWDRAVKAMGDDLPTDKSITNDLTKAGFSPEEVSTIVKADNAVDAWKRAQSFLYNNGLSEHDLLSGNMVERGAYQILRHTIPDLPIAVAARSAKTANTLLNAGFTLQQFESAAAMSPRFLDALKEGDTDKAWEYGTEALAGSALGVLGTSHALHSAGELFKPLIENNKFRPNDEWLSVDRANKEKEALYSTGEQMSINLADKARYDILGHQKPGILGLDKQIKAQQDLELASVLHHVVTGGDQNKAGQWFNALSEAAGNDERLPVIGSPNNGLEENANTNEGRPQGVLESETSTLGTDSQRGSELRNQIDSNVFKNQPASYQTLVLDSLKRVAEGSLSEKELAAAKFLRDEQDKNFEIGSQNDLLHHYLEDYMTRVYKDTNPQGKVILSDAKGGRFATNVSMAKQRVYGSNLTALLKSPKQMLLDPVDITAKGRGMLIKAAANRQLIDTLRDKFTRASDGRPAVVLSGSGQVVSGKNGEDPKTFIDPNRVRKINVDPKVVDQLSKSGDLQRFLDEGTIRDITPYVRPNNIGAAIDKLEEQSKRKEAKYDEVGNNKLRTDLMFLKSMQANGDFSGLKAFNDAQAKQYAWDPQDYISLANGAMKGWNFITNSPDGTPIYVRSDIRVHPEFAEYLQNRLGLAQSDIAKHPIGKALLGAGTRLKQTLLSLSPFHMVQEALRGIMVGVNPFHITGPDILTGEKVDPSDPNSPTIIRKAVEHGFTTGTDYSALQAHSEGLASGGGGLLSKIPGVGKVISNSLDWYQNFLFKRYIPALKSRSVELMFHEYQRLHPEWSVDRVAKAAALHANDTFGGINWQAMGRSATTQDWGRLMLLAPDWLEAEMRSGARLFNRSDGGLGRAQVAKMAMGLWGIARVLNYVSTGSPHLEAPFGLAVKSKEGKETVFSIRTLPTDLLHAAADPVGFIQGRLSPVVRAGTELTSGRDQFGRKLQPSDLWADVFRNMAPIPLQAVNQAVSGTGPEVGNIGQTVKALGGTAQTYQSPAQKMAADLASSHSEDGPVDPSQMARHHRVIQLEDQVRAGELSWPDLYKLTYQTDQLKESELKKIQENVKATHGMEAGMASLFSRASRLPAKEYLDLLDVTNPAERAALVPLTIKVQKRYLTKAKKEETPEERQRDPVFQRFLRMIPGSNQELPQPQSYAAPQIPPDVQREAAYLYTATHPETGHRVGSNDGSTWFDNQTGAPING